MILQKFSCLCCFSRETVISLDQSPASDFYSWLSLWILYKCSPNQPWEVLNLHKKPHSHYLALPNICFCIKLISAYSMCASMSLQNSICAPKVSEAALRWWIGQLWGGCPFQALCKILGSRQQPMQPCIQFLRGHLALYFMREVVNLAINYYIRNIILESGG